MMIACIIVCIVMYVNVAPDIVVTSKLCMFL
jgi:hypothetical protein